MPIDPRIVLEAGRGVLPAPQSFITTLRDIESIKAQKYVNEERAAQTKSRELANQKAIRNAAEEAAMGAAMSAAGGDPTKAIEILRRGGHPFGADLLEQMVVKNADKRATEQKHTMEAHLAALTLQSRLASGITDQASLDATRSLMMAMDKGIGPNSHIADALPKLYDEAGQAQVSAMVESGLTSLDRMRQKAAALKDFHDSIQLQLNIFNAQRAGNVSAEQIKNWQKQRRDKEIEGAAKLYASAKDDAEAQQIHDTMAPMYAVGVGGDPNEVNPLDMFSRDGKVSRQRARDYLTTPAQQAAGQRATEAGARAQREQDWRLSGRPETAPGEKVTGSGVKPIGKGLTANQLMAEYRLYENNFRKAHPPMSEADKAAWREAHYDDIREAVKKGDPEPKPPVEDQPLDYRPWLREAQKPAGAAADDGKTFKVDGLKVYLPGQKEPFIAKDKASLDRAVAKAKAKGFTQAGEKPAAPAAPAKPAPGTTAAPPPEPGAAAAAAAAGGTPPPNSTMRGGAPAQNQPTTAGQMYQMPKNQDLNEEGPPQEAAAREEFVGSGGGTADYAEAADVGDDGSRDIQPEPEPAPEEEESAPEPPPEDDEDEDQ